MNEPKARRQLPLKPLKQIFYDSIFLEVSGFTTNKADQSKITIFFDKI